VERVRFISATCMFLLICNRWMFILFPAPGAGTDFNPSQEEYLQCIKTIVGDDSLPVKILGISKWFINEIVAKYYSDGNMQVFPLIL
jgi:hypothetical protein